MLVDKDSKRYFTLAAGECPIHELYLPELLARNRGQRLSFSDSLAEAVQSSQAVLVAVGTPPALHWVFTPLPVPITEAFKQPIVTNPLGRFTLHSHCGNSGS